MRNISPFSPPFLKHFSRNIWVISLPVVLFVGATLGWIAYDEYQQVQESEYRLLEAHARNAEVRVADTLGKLDHLLHNLAGEIISQKSSSGGEITQLLNQNRITLPELGSVFTTDGAGNVHFATDVALIGQNVSRYPFFSVPAVNPAATIMFMSRPAKYFSPGKMVVFSLPIMDAQQRFIGILGVTIGYQFFPKALEIINPADSASMSVIFNHYGDLLYRRSNPEKFFGNNIKQTSNVFREHLRSDLLGTRHIGPSAIDGKTRLFVVRTVGETGLGIILSRQLDEVLAVWRRNLVIYILIFSFTLVGVIFLAIISARRKLLEEARIEALTRLHKIAGELPGMVYQFCLYPDGHSSFPYASEAIRSIFQLEADEVHEDAAKAFARLHPEDYANVVASIEQSARKLTHWQQEFRLKFADGTVRWLLGNAVPQKEADGVILWHGFITDISGRKQMELDIIAAKMHAEDANMAKSKFLAAASHDLRQPIHAQGLFLEALSRTTLSVQQRELLVNISAASSASVEMLNTLLDFSRVEAGVIQPQIQAFRLQPLLNTIEREFEPQADVKGLVYRSRETDWGAQSDPALVELILRNLVSNAINYTERGGVLVACRKRGEQVWLEVWDTGIGITPEHQQEVFREFHQLGNPERDRRKGLGLGLAIAQGLANKLGHDLTLRSTVRRGSVFRLALPLVTGVIPVEPLPKHGKMHMLNKRVLVIDDDEAVLSGMLHLLRGWGCVCDVTESIEGALAMARVHAPEVIISDYRLREQRTGVEAIGAVRAMLEKNIPALLITGDTAPDRLREARESGVPLLHKPLSAVALNRALADLEGRECRQLIDSIGIY